jgi:transcriptional regulator with XRE-family HTH domain
MSPFAYILRDLRIHRKLLQKDAAEMLGYEQSYISALENGSKGPPKQEFINKLIVKFGLDKHEQEQLRVALQKSKRKLIVPLAADIAEYELCHQLDAQLGRLLPKQIELIKFALSLRELCYDSKQNLFLEKELEETKM